MLQVLPRLRTDLESRQIQDELGIVYYDIYDPKSLGTLRLYEFEWLLAKQLEKPASLDQLIQATKDILGFGPTPEEMVEFVDHLRRFGLCEPPLPAPPAFPVTLALTTQAVEESPSQLAEQTSTAIAVAPTVQQSFPTSTPQKTPIIRAPISFSLRLLIKGILIPVVGLLIYLFVALFQ